MAIAGLVLGIISVVLSLIMCAGAWLQIIPLVLGVLALVLAIQGKSKQPEKKGVATAGLILGIIGAALSILFLILGLVVWNAATSVLGDFMNDPDLQDAMRQLEEATNQLESMTTE